MLTLESWQNSGLKPVILSTTLFFYFYFSSSIWVIIIGVTILDMSVGLITTSANGDFSSIRAGVDKSTVESAIF